MQIDTNDPRPIYVQIMDEIRRGIVLGAWHDDEALPSVRQLAAELRVNPSTVGQAYRELEREGVTYVRRGHGSYVAGRGARAKQRDALLRDVARRMLAESHRHGFSVAELTAALEREADSSGQNGTP